MKPFLEFKDKWTIVLGLTSNPGANDFEFQQLVAKSEILEEGVHISKSKSPYLYEQVLKTASGWGTPDNLMFVVGATQSKEFLNIRSITPLHFYLVPGVGFQGGSLKEISAHAMNDECGILVNASRAIIYASQKENFAEEARIVAMQYQSEMKTYIEAYKIAR